MLDSTLNDEGPPERAILIARIHETLRTAKTWRDLRDALPAQEFSTIAQAVTGREELLAVCYEFPFDPESIPGWVDGDYPPWLQQELESVLPREIISAFAKQVHTAVNGTYWHISEIDRPAVVNSLTKLGFTLDFEPEMPFH